jgi:hypothetical protein
MSFDQWATLADPEPRGGYLLIRSEDWAGLYDLNWDTYGPQHVAMLRKLAAHFDGAYIAGEPAGEVFYVPAEGQAIVAADVVTEMTPYNDNDYARRYIKIMAGTNVLAEVSHRVDGRS